MKRFAFPSLPIGLAVLSASAALSAQSVPHEKYTLPNGMTVILHEDHSVPLVAVNTWFRVGAKDEPRHRSGFAHLFEHLMFMGTERVPDNRFDTIMEGGGGSNNASTSEDRTNYFSDGPAAMLPTLLWLDADRFEAVGQTMDQAKLDRQREVVQNEIRQQVENAPYGRVERLLFQTMFPGDHPYHESTYGSHEDLESATVEDVRDFFANFYVPNNASLVIAGDFDPAAVKPMVERLFGTLPAAPTPMRRAVTPVRLDRTVRATMLDHVQLPLVKMVWHAPPSCADGTAELDLLAEVLASGKSSRLYRRLVEQEQIATDVSAYLDGLALQSLFAIEVYATPGADLDRVEAIVDEELARVRDGLVTTDELDRQKVGREVGQLGALQDLGRVADMLNRYEFQWGEPDSFARDLMRYRETSPASVQAAARQVLDPVRRAILRVLPQDPATAANGDPRDERPADFAPHAFHAEAPQRFTLANGMDVQLWRRPQLPLVNVRLQIVHDEPLVEPAHAGATAMAAAMLAEGAGDLDAAQFDAEMDTLGARLKTWVDYETANANLFVLRRNFDQSLHRMADALLRPRMQVADFERAQRIQLDQLRTAGEQPTSIASRVARRAFFGADDAYGWPLDGTLETIGALTLPQVQDAWRAAFAPRNATWLIAGDITVDDAKAALDREFGDWQAAPAANAPSRPAPAAAAAVHAPALRVLLVDRPGTPQTVIRLMAPAPAYRDPARIRLQVLGNLLGGSFTSRLNQNLREQHGYTYGAGAAFAHGPKRGWFSASTSVETSVTGAALKELLAEFARLRRDAGGDVSDDEVTKVQRTLHARIVESFERLDGIVGTAAELALNGLDFAQIERDIAAIDAVTAAQINAASRGDLELDHGVLVLVGDGATIRAQIGDLGLPPIEPWDADGKPIVH